MGYFLKRKKNLYYSERLSGGKTLEVSLKMSVKNKKDWLKKTQEFRKGSADRAKHGERLKEIELKREAFEKEARKKSDGNDSEYHDLYKADFLAAVGGKSEEFKIRKKSLWAAFDEYLEIKEAELSTGDREETTIKKLRTFYVRMRQYELVTLNNYAKGDCYKVRNRFSVAQVKALCSSFPRLKTFGFNDLGVKFESNFVLFLQDLFANSDTTVAKNISELKGFMKWVNEMNYFTFDKSSVLDKMLWDRRPKDPEPIPLVLEEVRTLHNLDLSEAPHLQKYLDLWLFGCHTGARISDALAFNKLDIKNEDGDYYTVKGGKEAYWTFITKKTNEECTVPLSSKYGQKALDILRKRNMSLPDVKEGPLNLAIKEICRLAGLDRLVSYVYYFKKKPVKVEQRLWQGVKVHTSRKTYISVLVNGGAPMVAVQKMVGHKQMGTTERYLKIESSLSLAAMNSVDMDPANDTKIVALKNQAS